MSFEYNGVVYRDLEPQVRYDAEQVQALKQEDVTINESLQTINTEIDGKLTKPANPSAESAVTMLADGTVGTKLLSEIGGGGGGKLYMHRVSFRFDAGDTDYLYIDIPTNTNDDITVDFLKNYIQGYCVVSYDGQLGTGAVNLNCTPYYAQISGAVRSSNATSAVNAINIHHNNANGLVIIHQILIEL